MKALIDNYDTIQLDQELGSDGDSLAPVLTGKCEETKKILIAILNYSNASCFSKAHSNLEYYSKIKITLHSLEKLITCLGKNINEDNYMFFLTSLYDHCKQDYVNLMFSMKDRLDAYDEKSISQLKIYERVELINHLKLNPQDYTGGYEQISKHIHNFIVFLGLQKQTLTAELERIQLGLSGIQLNIKYQNNKINTPVKENPRQHVSNMKIIAEIERCVTMDDFKGILKEISNSQQRLDIQSKNDSYFLVFEYMLSYAWNRGNYKTCMSLIYQYTGCTYRNATLKYVGFGTGIMNLSALPEFEKIHLQDLKQQLGNMKLGLQNNDYKDLELGRGAGYGAIH